MKYIYNAPFTILLQRMFIPKGQKDVYVNDFVIMCDKTNLLVEEIKKSLWAALSQMHTYELNCYFFNEGWEPACFLK